MAIISLIKTSIESMLSIRRLIKNIIINVKFSTIMLKNKTQNKTNELKFKLKNYSL